VCCELPGEGEEFDFPLHTISACFLSLLPFLSRRNLPLTFDFPTEATSFAW